jgi:hypothetical protein
VDRGPLPGGPCPSAFGDRRADRQEPDHLFDQANCAIRRTFRVPGVGKLIDRLTILDLFDRTT